MSVTSLGAANQYALPWPSHVVVSKVQFSSQVNNRFLCATGWDGSLRIFHVGTVGYSDQRADFYLNKPQLACTFVDDRVACGGLNNAVTLFDIESRNEFVLGTHNGAVRCLEYNPVDDTVVSGGWDATVRLWDTRESHKGPLQSVMVSERVYGMAVRDDIIVVGTRDRKIYVLDQRKLNQSVSIIESPLKFQIRSIAIEPAKQFFVVASIEGRIAIEHFDASKKPENYAFKAHRENVDGVEMIYPVNALDFHPYHGTFASGGSDAQVNIWDPIRRKRLSQFHRYNTTVCSLSFNFNGSQLAVGNSYLGEYSIDPVPKPQNQINVRTVGDVESRPKCI